MPTRCAQCGVAVQDNDEELCKGRMGGAAVSLVLMAIGVVVAIGIFMLLMASQTQ